MRYEFVTCDVFTDTRFGGNQLAVLPEASGLTADQMQQVAREFNFSESTFVLPPEQPGHDRRVRIFTPAREVPFAGHPNVGTAFALAASGRLGEVAAPVTVQFEEAAGIVAVRIEPRGPGRFWCELRAPEPFTRGRALPVELVAAAVGLAPEALRTEAHAPVVASVGLPFVIAELTDPGALARARPDTAALERLAALTGITPDVHLYTRADPGTGLDLQARMFAPFDGVPEDPATGSANGALAGLLASVDPPAGGVAAWRIGQGIEMGRPSLLAARVRMAGAHVSDVWIGGESVLVSEGVLTV